MTPAAIISDAQSEGVTLTLSPAGAIKATGDGVAVNRWQAVIRERKFEIIEVLKVGAVDTASMTAEEEKAIRGWLVLIGEADPATIAEVIGQCQRNADALGYFTVRAAADNLQRNRSGTAFDDDRRSCDQCANLIARRCQAATRGEIVASRNYEPIRELPRRCEAYAPRADGPDRRQGRERWPGLIRLGIGYC